MNLTKNKIDTRVNEKTLLPIPSQNFTENHFHGKIIVIESCPSTGKSCVLHSLHIYCHKNIFLKMEVSF